MLSTAGLWLAASSPSWNPLHFDPGTTALSFLIFFIVLALVGKFGWKPLLAAIEARENRIKDALSAAEAAQAGAEEARQAVENEMRRARAEAQKAIDESRQAAVSVAKDIEAKARREAEAIKTRATQEIELATRQAREEIRREAVSLALKAASAVIGRALEDEDHKRLAEEALSEVAS